MKLIAAFIFVLLPSTAAAAGWGTDTMLPASMKLIAALAIILGIILLLYYCSRKGLGFLPGPKTGTIKLIEVRHLMPKKSLFLVEVRGRELLLGVGVDRIELLSRLDWHNTTPFEKTLNTHLEDEPS
jgi:flagellar protein FliO/FliZ